MIRYKKSKRKIILGIAAAVILLAAVVFLSLRITEITVTGNHHYTSDAIQNELFEGRWDRNTIYCFYKDHFFAHKQIPFVEDYKIVFQSPSRVEVIVYEKSIVGYVTYMDSFLYFDKDGIVVESSDKKLAGVPQITGLKFGHIVLHQPIPVEDKSIFNQILNLTQLLSSAGIAAEEINYDPEGRATLFLGDIDVVLGSDDEMEGKIALLKNQLPVLKGRSGTLYLDTYRESDTNPTYRFEMRK